MLIAMAALSVRFGLLGMGGNIWIAMLSQLFNGFGYVAVAVSMAKYAAERLPDNVAGGQTLISLMFYGAARLLGSLLGGFGAEKTSIPAVFLMTAALCGLGFAGLLVFTVRKRSKI